MPRETERVLAFDGGSIRFRSPQAGDVAMELGTESRALSWLRQAATEPGFASMLRHAVATTSPSVDLWRWTDSDVLTRASRALAFGTLSAVRAPMLTAQTQAVKLEPTVARTASHWIEFAVEYPNGDPVSNLEYSLVDGSSQEQQGKLPGSGHIRKDGIASGVWALTLKDVENAGWRSVKALPGDPVMLVAGVSGYPDGTTARIRIFEELREKASECLQTLQGKVVRNQVALEVTIDDTVDALRDRRGEVAMIAEVAIGENWAKTTSPLVVELKTITRVAWMNEAAASGEEVALAIQTRGFADGTKIEIELFEHVFGKAPESLGALETTPLKSGVAEARFEWEGSPSDHGPGGHALHAEVHLKAGGIERNARSDDLRLLW